MLAFPQRGEAGVCRIGSAPFDLILNGRRYTSGYPHFTRPELALIPGGLASAHKRVQLLRHMIFKSHQDIVKRGQTTPITWQTFDVNLVKTVQGSGAVSFQRTKFGEHDAALGQAITSGCHEWVVMAANWTPNQYVGVASKYVDKRMYPAGTFAYAMYLHDGSLCSGAATVSRGFLGIEKEMAQGKALKSSQWAKQTAVVSPGTAVHVILDMDHRTLAFAIGDAEPCIAYTGLPDTGVHPYLCSGDIGDRSILVTVSGPQPPRAQVEPARQGWW